jgi:hypothetical protein
MPLAYVAWRAGTTYRVVIPVRQAGNRFLGSLKGLQIRALYLRTPSSLERGEMAYDGRRIEPSCLSSSGPAASMDKNQ